MDYDRNLKISKNEKFEIEQKLLENEKKHKQYQESIQDLVENYKTSICSLKISKNKIEELEDKINILEQRNHYLEIRSGSNFAELTPRPSLENLNKMANELELLDTSNSISEQKQGQQQLQYLNTRSTRE